MIKILVVLMLCPSCAFAQGDTDSLYTMKLKTARLLVADAMRARVLDSMNVELSNQVKEKTDAYEELQGDVDKMVANFGERLRLQEDSNKELVTANKDLRSLNRKERRKVKGWKVGTVVGFGVGIYLGVKMGD